MRVSKFLGVITIATALSAMACNQSPTASEQALPDASFNFSNGPGSPGESGVFRSPEGRIALRLVYVRDGLEVWHFQADDTFRCGGSNPDPLWDAQRIANPQDKVDAIVRIAHGNEIPVFIYPLRDGSVPLCDWFATHWLFKGVGSLTSQDNNVDFAESRPVDAFGYQGHGEVVDRDDTAYKFTEAWRVTAETERPGPFELHASPNKITLTRADNDNAGPRRDESCRGNSVVTFEDANFEAAVRLALGLNAEEDITCELASGLTELSGLPDAPITSLEGAQNLISLTLLNLRDNLVSDLSPIARLTTLRELDLTGNPITDISAVSGLVSLVRLSLVGPAGGGVTNISALAGLTSLSILELHANSITDIEPLAGLTSLTFLGLGENAISDITPLSELTALWLLDLDRNSIDDIDALGDLTSLLNLRLAGNSIDDISSLQGLTNLEQLFLMDNATLSNITPLLNNTDFESGDSVDLSNVDPALSCVDVGVLRNRGVTVTSTTCSP